MNFSGFYKRNGMDVPQLIQKGPEYAEDADKVKELAEGRSDNADAQDKYLKQNGALQVPHFVRCKISQ